MTLTLPNGMILSGTVDEIKEFIDRSTPISYGTSSGNSSGNYIKTDYCKSISLTNDPINQPYNEYQGFIRDKMISGRFGTSEVDCDKPIHDKLREAKNYERQFNNKN